MNEPKQTLPRAEAEFSAAPCSASIPNPVKLGFDPRHAEEAIQTIFADKTARTLWLSWRVGHIVSQYFVFDCFESAKRIRVCVPPITEDDLKRCLTGGSFQCNDVALWVADAVRFFNDEELRFVTPNAPN